MMDEKHIEKLLEENLALAKENHKILSKMRRAQRFAAASRIIYFLIVIGFFYGAYYFLAPYMKRALDMYESLPTAVPDWTNYVPGFKDFEQSLPEDR